MKFIIKNVVLTIICISFFSCSLYHPIVGIYPNDKESDNQRDLLSIILLMQSTPSLPVSGARIWFRADQQLVYDGTTWSWTNLAMDKYHATGLINSKVENAMGGQTVARFGGVTSEYMATASVPIGTFTIFSVWQVSSSATVRPMLYEHSSNAVTGLAGFWLLGSTASTAYVKKSGTVSNHNHPGGVNWAYDDISRIATHTFDGTHAGHTIRLNGVDQALLNLTTNNPGTTTYTDLLFIGNRGSTKINPMKGDIAEIIIYPSSLSTSDRTSVECYLSNRYSISISGC